MTDSVDLSTVYFAELVAPAITRAFVTGMKAGGAAGQELVASYGGRAVGYLIDLRNPLAAGRAVTRKALGEVYRYANPAEVDENLQRSVDGGLLAQAPDGEVTVTARGDQFLRDLFALQATALSRRWGPDYDQTGVLPHGARVERLNRVLSRLLTEAAATAGPAWAVQAPPHEPERTHPAMLLLNRLSTLRYHRADAHAAAWQAAGLTAADLVAMPWGSEWTPQRAAVEHDTNVRAGAPYAVLTPPERLTMLADLAALP